MSDDADYAHELGKNKWVSIRKFKGQQLVDIREFYESDGKRMPGRKGISLTLPQWKELMTCVGEIQGALGIKSDGPGEENTSSSPKRRRIENENADDALAEERATDPPPVPQTKCEPE